jgi:hypothetical protein
MDGEYMYNFMKNNYPESLGSLIIQYVDKLKQENISLKIKINKKGC